jgi:hypothetical protein
VSLRHCLTLIHTETGNRSDIGYDVIGIVAEERENGDRGEAIYFKGIIKYEQDISYTFASDVAVRHCRTGKSKAPPGI